MKIKMSELVESYPSLDKLSKVNLVQLGLIYKEIKQVIILLKKAKEELLPYDKIKLDLLTKYGKRDEKNPGVFNVLVKNLETFNKEMIKVHNQEIEINYEKILLKKMDDLIKQKDTNLNTDDVMKLELFFNME